ncbi:MAG: cell filamentation protein Fic [Parachlamydiales bacterium]|nr:cell filamentation protein Fic [Parachlamydiales bacterium]
MYIYELKNWPHFLWDQKSIVKNLVQIRHQQGRLQGGMESIGFSLQEKTILTTLTQDVVKSSEIEGEILDQTLVRSSVARHLGIDIAADTVDRNIDGVVEMMLDATQKFDQPLTKERLFNWHTLLFPVRRNGFSKIRVGAWRTGPVQVVSGQMGKETVHLEAPPAEIVDHEMELFLNWLNNEMTIDPVLKAAIAHLWFVTIHPFDDGNGRIGRAVADLMLARSEKSSRRFYSLSAQIQKERKHYYDILERTQKGGLDITSWIEWFFGCLERAIEEALFSLETIVHKVQFWEARADIPFNERQRKIINRLLDGFEGKLTSSKWAKIAKCSQDTAYRDILDMINRGILIKNLEGGRSTSYSLVDPKSHRYTAHG